MSGRTRTGSAAEITRIINDAVDRREDDKRDAMAVAAAWYDGADSQMYAFGRSGRSTFWAKLLRELQDARAACVMDDERPKLDRAVEFVRTIVWLQNSLRTMAKTADAALKGGALYQDIPFLAQKIASEAMDRQTAVERAKAEAAR